VYLLVAAPLMLLFAILFIIGVGVLFVFGGAKVLPGVSIAAVSVGGMSINDAAHELEAIWNSRGVLLRDGAAVYPVAPDLLGLTLDPPASARRAYDYGRVHGGLEGVLKAAFAHVSLAPVVSWHAETLAAALASIAPQIETVARNAGVQVVNGQVLPRAGTEGRMIDIAATIEQLARRAEEAFADGGLDLVMYSVAPAITDPTALVEAARVRLASPFALYAYNPVNDVRVDWTVPPEVWSLWITADADGVLNLDAASVQAFLGEQAQALPASVYIDDEKSAGDILAAFAGGASTATIRLYNHDREHTVQPGETITSIAWDYGVPYLYIQRANPGLENGLSAGQTISIPSADNFMIYPVVANKRIVVSMSEQRVRVYENGTLKWDWVASTGIASSPTWPGIYQIISHEPNAYAGNWDLWMPNFLGVYRPIPDADFTNGFHGFPTRSGNQLLWTDSLGIRVTYGCILLSDENAAQLYQWAEQGVVVAIMP
jgi:lipoprotein-anchoring transpeptidase ErfK/SrfK